MYCLWHETDTTLLNSCTCEIEMHSKKRRVTLTCLLKRAFKSLALVEELIPLTQRLQDGTTIGNKKQKSFKVFLSGWSFILSFIYKMS